MLSSAGKRRYNIKLWKTFTDCFNCLPIAAIGIGSIILCLLFLFVLLCVFVFLFLIQFWSMYWCFLWMTIIIWCIVNDKATLKHPWDLNFSSEIIQGIFCTSFRNCIPSNNSDRKGFHGVMFKVSVFEQENVLRSLWKWQHVTIISSKNWSHRAKGFTWKAYNSKYG